MKTLSCRDVGLDCDWQVTASSEQEVLQKALEHGKKEHGITEIDAKLRERIVSHIRDSQAA